MAGVQPLDWLTVGTAVMVSKYRAVVKYLGAVDFSEGIWAGLELELERGKHDGTVNGRKYFTARMKHGTFMKPEQLLPYHPATAAAASIQSFHRVCVAKRKVSEAALAASFIRLDADAENRQLLRQQKLLGTELGLALSRERPTGAQVDAWVAEAASAARSHSADANAAVLPWPITPAGVIELMRAFRDGRRLPYKDAISLIASFRRYAASMPTLVELVVEKDSTLTVVGDTHGQLADLLTIFSFQGTPTAKNAFLFNGDFVDRGDHGIEVMLVLMAWVLTCPGQLVEGKRKGAAVYLLRGNHESHAQNFSNGFMQQVFSAYYVNEESDQELRLYDAFQAAFDALPLASVIVGTPCAPNEKVFVVHGGLMDDKLTLAQIASVNRSRDVPYGQPSFSDRVFEHLMWSDPGKHPGLQPSDRGAGCTFGSDITAAFCALNGIKLVLRSHEQTPEGVLFTHEGRLATVFSASRYCGRGTNAGGVVILDSALAYTVKSWDAPALLECRVEGDDATSPVAARKSVPSAGSSAAALAQSDAVNRMLIERIILHKADLYFAFSTIDKAHCGRVTRGEWADAMRSVLGLDIPWIRLCPSLADVESDGCINYSRFLERYRIAMRASDLSWMEAMTVRISEKLFAAGLTLEESFRRLDEDKSGKISFDEFERGLHGLDCGLSHAQLYEFMHSIDKNLDGTISYSEFCARFKYTYSVLSDNNKAGSFRAVQTSTIGAGIVDTLHRIGNALRDKELDTTFAIGDADGDGVLSLNEFTQMLDRLNLNLTREEAAHIFRFADENDSGAVNFDEVRRPISERNELLGWKSNPVPPPPPRRAGKAS